MVYLVFVLCCLIWGSTFLFISVGNETVDPLWAATLRLVIAAPLLALMALITRAPFPKGRALRAAVLFGIFNFGINLSLLYWGELTVPSGIAAVFYATVPLSTGLFAAAFGVEALDPRKMLFAGLAVMGVAIIFAGELSFAVPFAGLLAILIAATAAGLSSVFLKQVPQAAIPANAVGSVVGAAICFAGSVLLGEHRTIPTTADAWIPILYLVVAGSLGAYVLFTWLVHHWAVTNATLVGVVVPVIAVALGIVFRSEQAAPATYLGAAVVLVSVFMAIRLTGARRAPPVPEGAPPTR